MGARFHGNTTVRERVFITYKMRARLAEDFHGQNIDVCLTETIETTKRPSRSSTLSSRR